MVLLIDTNIFLDIYLNRADFIKESKQALLLAKANYDTIYFSCSSVTDFFYIANRSIHNKDLAKKYLIDLIKNTNLANVNDLVIYNSLLSRISDYEDAVLDAVATSINADIILTRNKKDFINSTNKVLTPEEYLQQY